jgi:hypothetical protein
MGTLSAFNRLATNVNPYTEKVYNPYLEPSQIYALAIADKGQLAAWGGKVGTAPNELFSTAGGIVQALRRLELLGKATVFPTGTISGKKAKPVENPSSFVPGNQDEADVASVTNSFEFMYRDAWTEQNVEFLNKLRGNHTNKDVFVFTENGVIPVQVAGVSFFGVGSEIEGDKKKDITGGFSLRYTVKASIGEPKPYFGVDKAALADYAKLTFGAPTAGTNITANGVTCEGGALKYNVTAAQGGTLTFAVVETTTCLEWAIFKCNADGTVQDVVTATDKVAISQAGVVTITTQSAAKTTFQVVARNTCGHEAVQNIEITWL